MKHAIHNSVHAVTKIGHESEENIEILGHLDLIEKRLPTIDPLVNMFLNQKAKRFSQLRSL